MINQLGITKRSIGKVIVSLGFYFSVERGFHIIGGVLEIVFLGVLGPAYISAAVLSITALTFVGSLLFELGTGLSCIVTQLIGKNDSINATRTLSQTIVLCFLLSIPFSVFGVLATPLIFNLFGVEYQVKLIGIEYLSLGFGFLFIIATPFIINSYFRAVGEAKTAVGFEFLQLCLIVILLPTFIFGYGFFPKLYATGGILALITARGIVLLMQLIFLWKRQRTIFQLRNIIPDLPLMGRIIRLSVPSTIHQTARYGADLLVVRLVANFGTLAVAAYAIAMQLIHIVDAVGQGFGNAIFTFVGQNIGAGYFKRANKGVLLGLLYSSGLILLLTVLSLSIPNRLALIFNQDALVVDQASMVIRLLSLTYICVTACWIYTRAFHGVSDTVSPMIIDTLVLWVVQIPIGILVVWKSDLLLMGICLAISLSNILRTLAMYLVFNYRFRKLVHGQPEVYLSGESG